MDLDQCACSGKTLSRFVRPALLALLAESPMYGYDLLRRLAELAMFADPPPDAGGVYKVLKTMEEEGLISGDWEQPESGNPRRGFRVTSTGRKCLARWSETLARHQSQIAELQATVRKAVKR